MRQVKGYKALRHRGRMLRVHRLIASLKIGRPLEAGEEVHHVDGNRTNNHPANLVVLSKRAHTFLHHFQRRESKGVQHLFALEVYLELLDQKLLSQEEEPLRE